MSSSVESAPVNAGDEPKDTLLQALVYLAEHEKVNYSVSSLVSGLPLVDGCLTPELFKRAAGRIGFGSSIEQRPLADIPELVMPCVLLQTNNRALVLLAYTRDESSAGASVRVFDPLLGRECVLPMASVLEDYSGFAIFTKIEAVYDPRAQPFLNFQRDHWFWSTLGHSSKIYRDVLVASFFINLFVLANPLFVMNVYDRVVPNDAVETLWALALGVGVVYIFDFILKTLRSHFIELAGKKSDVLLSSYIFERVLGAKYSEHPLSTGSFVSQLRDFDSIRNFITSSTVTAFIDLPFILLFLVVIIYIGGSVAWVPVVMIPIVIVYALVVQRLLQKSVAHTFAASAQKNATLVEAINNLETLKSIGAEGRVQRAWEKAVGLLATWSLKSRLLSNSATTFAGFVQQLSSVLVVIVGVYAIAEKELTMGALIACVILTSRVLAPLSQIAGLLVQYKQSVLALEALNAVVSKAQERPDGVAFIKRELLRGEITFENVVFSYQGEERPTLKDINFSIKAGERVAIIGRLGSGKSTMHKLMLGLYQPQQGAVLFDGLDSKQLDPADLRQNMGYVPQSVSLFFGSIRDNIAYKNEWVSDKEVLRVADLCGVTEFANTFPQGFSRIIQERGEGLSGGQKQAVNLARGLVNSPPILLLDEPTTAMDNTSEARLLARLKSEVEGKTLVLITHKTTLLALVDRVLVMDKGRIVADGSKESVLQALKSGQLNIS